MYLKTNLDIHSFSDPDRLMRHFVYTWGDTYDIVQRRECRPVPLMGIEIEWGTGNFTSGICDYLLVFNHNPTVRISIKFSCSALGAVNSYSILPLGFGLFCDIDTTRALSITGVDDYPATVIIAGDN